MHLCHVWHDPGYFFIVLTKPLILISCISFAHCNSFLTERRICPQTESWKFSHAGEEEHFLPDPKYIDRNHKWLWMTSKTVLREGKKMQNRSLIVMDDLGASRLNTPLENEIKALCPDRRRDKLKKYIYLLLPQPRPPWEENNKGTTTKKKRFSSWPHRSHDFTHQGEIETVNPVSRREKGLSQRRTCLNVNRSVVLVAEPPPPVPPAPNPTPSLRSLL